MIIYSNLIRLFKHCGNYILFKLIMNIHEYSEYLDYFFDTLCLSPQGTCVTILTGPYIGHISSRTSYRWASFLRLFSLCLGKLFDWFYYYRPVMRRHLWAKSESESITGWTRVWNSIMWSRYHGYGSVALGVHVIREELDSVLSP